MCKVIAEQQSLVLSRVVVQLKEYLSLELQWDFAAWNIASCNMFGNEEAVGRAQ